MTRLNLRLIVTTTTAFAVIVYAICVAIRPLFPSGAMNDPVMWAALLPGFSWTAGGLLLGLIEVALYGALGSALFVGLYTFFAPRLAPAGVPAT